MPLHKFDYFEADELAKIIHLTNSLWSGEDNSNPTILKDKVIVITGKLKQYKNRDLLKDDIEKYGGKVVTSVTKNTSYLINNDVDSTSAKNITAKKLGVPIITEAEFISRFLTK